MHKEVDQPYSKKQKHFLTYFNSQGALKHYQGSHDDSQIAASGHLRLDKLIHGFHSYGKLYTYSQETSYLVIIYYLRMKRAGHLEWLVIHMEIK